jgi:hypothetical protein
MKKRLPVLISLLLFFSGRNFAQITDSPKYHIAVFLPLYLDSAFDANGSYRYDQNFPKFINPGLEFYEGLELAADSLVKVNAPLDITVYDTRSATKSIQQVLADSAFSKTQLIIGYVSSSELYLLANAARTKDIPFINVNYPNDAGVSNNPEFVILNTTLHAHFEALYKFMQRNWATSNIVYLRKKGATEDRILAEFAGIEKTTPSVPLKMKYLTVDNSLDNQQLTSYLDSNTKNIVLIGSLDDGFAKACCAQLSSLNKTYPIKIIGMPTWDAIADFNTPTYPDQEIYYSTPFYMNPADSLVSSIQQYFKSRFYSRPSDMVYRGYETTLHFGQLLIEHKGVFDGSIGERKFKVFNDFDLQPVFSNKDGGKQASGHALTLQYLENKKVYFIKKVNGNIVAVY